MPYLGNTPTTQNFISGTDYFNGTGAQTAFTLTRTVNSVNDIQVVVNNVVQQPNDAYTLSGTTLTFTSAPSSGTNNVYVRYLSTTLQSITPSYGSIIPSMLNPPNTIYWDTTQNVGIGTSSPTNSANYKTLSLNGTTGGQLAFQSNGTLNGSIYNDASGNFVYSPFGYAAFWTAGAERMRIDTSGNVGIGISSPSSPLDVNGWAQVTTNASAGAGLRVRPPSGSGSPAIIQFTNNPVNAQWASITSPAANVLTFNDGGGVERARVNSIGLRVGNTGTGPEPFHVGQAGDGWTEILSNSKSSGQGLLHLTQFTTRAPNDSTSIFYYSGDTVGVRFLVYSNGGVVNYQANDGNLSDRREKTNFAPAPSYLEKICSVPVQTFNYIDQNLEEDAGLTLGVVAQDLQAVAPELVKESNWAKHGEEPKMRLSIYQTDLQYALMKCIQEQQAMIEELKARIETLEAK